MVRAETLARIDFGVLTSRFRAPKIALLYAPPSLLGSTLDFGFSCAARDRFLDCSRHGHSGFLCCSFCALSRFSVIPNRAAPADPNVIVAAADGTVMDIVELDENEVLKNKTRRVGIFLSIFDVHTNRAPIDGRIIYRQHRPGLCLDARRPDCSEKNESMTWAFENPRVTIVVRQITGAIARRIVAWANVGDELKKGERFGMIRFGSRTELYLPLSADDSRQSRRPRGGWIDTDCATA